MTTDEIRALISTKIAGQGSMVDVGGGLPQILNEILNAIEQGTGLGIIDVTEDLASGDITYERYEQLAHASFVKYEGLIYVAGQFIPGLDLPDNASEIKFFTNLTLYKSDGTVNSTYCIVAYVLGTTWKIETKEI